MRKIGVTATRNGLTLAQVTVFSDLFGELVAVADPEKVELHHGDCVGGDATLDRIAKMYGVWRVGHPPTNDAYRAWCDVDELLEPKEYIARNHDIVDVTTELWVGAGGMTEQQRSGTWATVRYARRHDRPITIVFPDGSVKKEGQR